MKKYWIIISLLLLTNSIQGQHKLDAQWLFGMGPEVDDRRILMDFQNPPLNILEIFSSMDIYLSNSSICNKNGDLLFYSNGCQIYNRNHQIMMNGDSINAPYTFDDDCDGLGYTIPQGLIILPRPGSDHKFFVFHQRDTLIRSPRIEFPVAEFLYSEVDMRENNGKGGVTKKNVSIIKTQLNNGLLTAVKNSNNEDWWLITSKRRENILFIHHLKQDTITTREQQIGLPVSNEGRGAGQAVFSPDGTRYAQYNPRDGVYLYDFDRSTGEFSNFQQFTFVDSAFVGGLAFAPNSRYLYVVTQFEIYQFDVQAVDVAASQLLVAEYDGTVAPLPTTFRLAQLGPDCRIYISPGSGGRFMSVINYPNRRGAACDVEQNSIVFPTTHSGTIPNFPNYRLGTEYPVCDSSLYTSVEEVSEEEKFSLKVAPNPTMGEIIISVNSIVGNHNALLSIRNLTGQLLRQLTVDLSSSPSLDISDLPAGVYFLQVESEDGVSITSKIVKQ